MAGGRAPNISVYVDRALEEQIRLDVDALLGEPLLESGGSLTGAERDQIDQRAGWR